MLELRSIRRGIFPLLVAAAGLIGPRAAAAQPDARGVIPADTVVRLRMDSALNSREALEGDRFAAVLDTTDRSGFPVGTRFQGTVREVQQYTKDRPGTLDVEFLNAYLPDGGRVPLRGRLASVSGDDVRRTENGRLEPRKRGGKKVDWKWAGYGAGAGAVLSTVLGGQLLKGALLGGLGGAAYGYLNRGKGAKDHFRDVDLPRGTEFGMRLEQQTTFAPQTGYRYSGSERSPGVPPYYERVLGERQDAGYGTASVRLDGRAVEMTEHPIDLNGVLFVPLAPVARAANMRFTRRSGEERFVLETPAGPATGRAGETRVTLPGGEAITLSEAPVSLNGTIYVSADYLHRVAQMRADWDAEKTYLYLTTGTTGTSRR